MAQKTGNLDIIEFIPKVEREDKQPFTVCFRPMRKSEWDKYANSLAEMRKGKVVTKLDKAFEMLCDLTLTPSPKDGAYIRNVWYTGEDKKEFFHAIVTDKTLAINMLIGMQNVECANEIENNMRGQSTIEMEEEKNSDGQ